MGDDFRHWEISGNGKAGLHRLTIDHELVLVPALASVHRPFIQMNQVLDIDGLLQVRGLCSKTEGGGCTWTVLSRIRYVVVEMFAQERLSDSTPPLISCRPWLMVKVLLQYPSRKRLCCKVSIGVALE